MSKEPNSTAKSPENNTAGSPPGTTSSPSRTAGSSSAATPKSPTDSSPVTREQIADDLQRTIQDARRYLEQMGEQGRTKAREKCDETQDQVEQWRAQGEDMIRQKPFTAVAIALAVGWVIGKLGD